MNFKIHVSNLIPILLLSFAIVACSGNKKSDSGTETVSVTMYKNPGCECCTKWADHLEANGFEVTEEPTPKLQAIKAQYDIPYDMASCHTAVIGDYIVEGHVPAANIKSLLAGKPDAVGLAVPGMPIGSPGMEVPGRAPEAYNVYLFKEDGSRQVYAQH